MSPVALDFNAGGYRYKDLLRERIVSSRSDLHDKQKRHGFPRPIKTGVKAAWFPKSEVHGWLAQRAALRDRPNNPEQPTHEVRGHPGREKAAGAAGELESPRAAPVKKRGDMN